ncbi:MAG: hypothetical protein IKJ32_06190 [Clostridia bacterium]|nr:hypothetical protein [Clostridia bacterium]
MNNEMRYDVLKTEESTIYNQILDNKMILQFSKKIIENVILEYTNNMKKIYNSVYECINNILITSLYDSDIELEVNKSYEDVKSLLETKLNRSDIEWGVISEFDEYIINNIQDENVLKAVNQIYLDNYNNEEVLVKILNAISEVDYKLISPHGQLIAIAGISNKNLVVKQKAIQAFERWHNSESINILENIDVREKWLKKYVQKVLEDLKEKVDKYG